MKVSRILLMLLAALILALLCCAGATAEVGQADETVYELYPDVGTDREPEERVYQVPINSDIVITFMDLEHEYGRLDLDFVYNGEETDKAIEAWKSEEWDWGGSAVAFKQDDHSWFQLSDYKDVQKANGDYEKSYRDGRKVEYCIKKENLEKMWNKVNDITFKFYVGDNPDDDPDNSESMHLVWCGHFYLDSTNPRNAKPAQKLTLSAIQLKDSKDGNWRAELEEDEDSKTDPKTVWYQTMSGLSVVEDGQYDGAKAVVAKRWIEGWKNENRETYALRVVRDDKATDDNATDEELYIDKPQYQQTNTASTDNVTLDTTPMDVVLMLEHGDEQTELVTKDENGLLPAEFPEPLEPGDYKLLLSGKNDLICKLSIDEADPLEMHFSESEREKDLKIEAGKSYVLDICEPEGESIEVKLEGAPEVRTPIEFDPDPAGLTKDGKTEPLDEAGITIEDRDDGRQLSFSGTAQDGINMSWELNYKEASLDSGTSTATDDNEKSLDSGTSTATDGKWSVNVDLSKDDFKDIEGKLEFVICYQDDPDSQKDWPVSIDTKAVEKYIQFEMDGVIYPSETDTSDVILPRENEKIKIHFGEKKGEDKHDMLLNTSGDAYTLEDLRNITQQEVTIEESNGVFTIKWGEAVASLRLVSLIEITGASVKSEDGTSEDVTLWICAADQGKTLVISGEAEPNEKLEWRIYTGESESADAAQDKDGQVAVTGVEHDWKSCVCDSNGSWTVEEYTLTEELANANALTFEIRYQEKKLSDAIKAPEPYVFKVDMVAPAAPMMTLLDQNDNETNHFLSGDNVCVKISNHAELENDGAAVDRLVLSGRAVPVEPDGEGNYTIDNVSSGSYKLTATAVDQAGNPTEKAMEFEVATKISVSVANEGGEGDRPFNADEVQDGLRFRIDADANRDLQFQCQLEDGRNVGGEYDEDSQTYVVTVNNPVSTYNRNGGKPVGLVLKVSYKSLGEEKFQDACEVKFDIWKPKKPSLFLATTGEGFAVNKMYFDGEPICLRITGLEEGATVSPTVNGVEMKQISREEFDALPGENSEALDTDRYYALEEGCSEKTLSIDVAYADEAGNADAFSEALNRNEDVQEIHHSKIEGTLTHSEGSVVTVKGNNAIPNYYLVSDDPTLKDRRIQVSSMGTWELELTTDDLMQAENTDVIEHVTEEGKEKDLWCFTLRYPSEFYNIDSIIDKVEVPLDIACNLEWAEEPMVGARSVSVVTDPKARLELYLGNDDQPSVVGNADGKGNATLELAHPVGTDTRIYIKATDAFGNDGKLWWNDEGKSGETAHAGLTAEFAQDGANGIRVTGTGEPGYAVELSVNGTLQATSSIGEDGAFEVTGEVDEGATSVDLSLSYEIFRDQPITHQMEMDREPPQLSLEQQVIYDIGGDVTVSSEAGASIAFVGVRSDGTDSVSFLQTTMEKDLETVPLPKLGGYATVEVRATDPCGNVSDPVVLKVIAAPPLMAGFEQPGEGADLDSEGMITVTGWVATAEDAAPEGLTLVVAQNGVSEEHAMGAEAEVALAKGERSADIDEIIRGKMDSPGIWRFEYTLPMAKWDKGDLEIRVHSDGEAEALTSRKLVSGVDANRKRNYILLCFAALAGLAACAAAIIVLNKRIRRISDGRVDPASGMSKLTERSRQQSKY